MFTLLNIASSAFYNHEGVKFFVQGSPQKQLVGYGQVMESVAEGALVRSVFKVDKNLVVGVPVSTFEAFHEADTGPNRTGFSSSFLTNNDGYVDQNIFACHIYQDGYSLVSISILDGSSLKEKKVRNFNLTAASQQLLFQMS